MGRLMIFTPGVLGLLLLAGSAMAESPELTEDPTQVVCRFVDEDGDGFNDLAPDADGDGIPNGLDPDYVRPEDGTGNQHQYSWVGGLFSRMFGMAETYQNSHQGSGQIHETGPGVNAGFGPGESSGSGAANGEDQAERAGHRGGRR